MKNNISNKLNNYLEASSFLGNESITTLLESFIEKNKNQKYELPLIGQFSSGKSATVNHFLNRNLLPTKSIETTAFATYITYSKDEFAQLELEDGSIESISFEEIKTLDNTKVEETGKKIKSLTIGIDSNVLKNGLTFVDTPGVNTIITTHIEITERILRDAQYIVYVLAKSLTEEDILMIQTIEMKNIPMIFIRTHLDEIKDGEENWNDVVLRNKKAIEMQLGHSIHFFAISNDTNRHEFDANFIELSNFLSNKIALNVQEVYASAIEERLVPIKTELESEINSQLSLLENNKSKSLAEIEKQKSHIEYLVDDWNTKSNKQQEIAFAKAQETKADIKSRIELVRNNCIKNFEININNAEADKDSLNALVSNALTADSSKINIESESILIDAADAVCKRLGEDIKTINTELETVGIDTDCVFDLSIVQNYAERMNSIEEEFESKANQIRLVKEELEANKTLSLEKKRQLEDAIAEAEAKINAYESEAIDLNDSYEPRYIEKESKLAPIGKVVGTVCDLAMLFIPGPTWASWGSKLGKIGKAGSTLRKVGKVAGKAAKVISKTDAAKDAMTMLGGLKNAKDKYNGTLNKTSIFDYVSLSYWFEKAGNAIDPSGSVLDKEYETQYVNQLNSVKSKIEAAQVQKLQQIKALEGLNGSDWAAKQREREIEKNERLLEDEKNKIKDNLDKEMKTKLKDSLKQQAKSQYNSKFNEYSSVLLHKIEVSVDSIFSSIVEAADMKIKGQLSSLVQQLDEIKQNKESNKIDFDQKISTLKGFKESL